MEPDETTAQDVIDALRLVLKQDDPDPALVGHLVAQAPINDTGSRRGVQLIIDGISEGSIRVDMADAPSTPGGTD